MELTFSTTSLLYQEDFTRAPMAENETLTLDDMYGYYTVHSEEILGYLINRGFDQQTAEDLTHDTFFKACRQVSKGKVRADNVRAWLFRIAHNNAISRYRRKSETPVAQVEKPGEDSSLRSDEKMLSESILLFVRKNFSEREREIFDLRIVQAMTFQETADILGMSKTTVIRIDENNLRRIKEHFGEVP